MMSAPTPLNFVPRNRIEDQLFNGSYQKILEEEELKYGSEHVVKLFIPVTICMLIVVATLNTFSFYQKSDTYFLYTPFHSKEADTSTIILESVGNSLVLLSAIVTMTILLIVLYKYKFYRLIEGWLLVACLFMLFMLTYLYLIIALRHYNTPMDHITIALIVWNFGTVGMICINWKGPLVLQQAYLSVVAALMALILLRFIPEWTVWVVLCVISVWDLIAVLCPKGPLRILVETAEKRGESIFPAMIYSSAMVYMTGEKLEPQVKNKASILSQRSVVASNEEAQRSSNVSSISNLEENPRQSQSELRSSSKTMILQSQVPILETSTENEPIESEQLAFTIFPSTRETLQEDNEASGVKLGLGDFIFYSVLVGQASSFGDWNVTIACFVSILIGLCLTLLLLAFFKKALPALPISIFFGVTFYFATRSLVSPFYDRLTSSQIYL